MACVILFPCFVLLSFDCFIVCVNVSGGLFWLFSGYLLKTENINRSVSWEGQCSDPSPLALLERGVVNCKHY